MHLIADLQLHSKYSRAVSSEMVIPKMYEWNLKKRIGLLATGDWTHPLWIQELKTNLEELGTGFLKIKEDAKKNLAFNTTLAHGDPLFLLSGEVSCIYTHNGKTRRNHILLFAPSFEVVDKINAKLVGRGANLSSDGRPILGLSSQEICELVWSISEEVLVIPAHAWTPWFSIFGSISGYDSLAECFGDFAERIFAIETGLSSNPAMNWRIPELDTRTIVSFSDAHSGPKLMREATIFAKPDDAVFSFSDLRSALENYQGIKTKPYIAGTVEFYPEEGKYHFDGHRNCNVRQHPDKTKKIGTLCPVCGRQMTIGVLSRVEELANRSQESLQLTKKPFDSYEVQATYSETFPQRPPYIMMVPLQEIIAESFEVAPASKKVVAQYDQLVAACGGEFNVLFKMSLEELKKHTLPKVVDGIDRVRRGEITIIPGYDGVFGTVKIWSDEKNEVPENQKQQLTIF